MSTCYQFEMGETDKQVSNSGFNIRISLIEPGFFKTNLHNSFEYAEPIINDYNPLRKNALPIFSESIKKADTPETIAKIVLKILNEKKPGFPSLTLHFCN